MSLPSLTWSVSPFILQSDGLTLRWFNLLWVSELVVGYWLLARQIRRGGGEDVDAADLAVHVWIGLTVGARLGEVVFYSLDHALSDPGWIFRFWTGGISSHGAVVGSALAVLVYARRRALPPGEVTDRLVFSFGAGAVLHRIASLLNSEVVGKPTDGSWGVRFPLYDEGLESAPLRHPSQLYEALLGAVLLGVLYLANRRWGEEQRPRGALTGLALVCYFAGRFAVEFLKEPQAGEVAGALLNHGQWLSVPFVAVGTQLLRRSLRHPQPAGWRLREGPSAGAPSADDAPPSSA